VAADVQYIYPRFILQSVHAVARSCMFPQYSMTGISLMTSEHNNADIERQVHHDPP
jgi:hypothetical protein